MNDRISSPEPFISSGKPAPDANPFDPSHPHGVAFLFGSVQTQQKTIVFSLILARPSGSEVVVTVRIRFRRMRCPCQNSRAVRSVWAVGAVRWLGRHWPQKIIPAILTGGADQWRDVNWRCHPLGRFNWLPDSDADVFAARTTGPSFIEGRSISIRATRNVD